jgi:hypothetical protein
MRPAPSRLTFAINSDGSCIDPHQSPADVDGFFARPVLDSLVALGTDGTIHPWLATAWTVSADQLTSPAQVADRLDAFVQNDGSDGFIIGSHLTPTGLDEFVEKVVPLLQERGSLRTAYDGTTLRDNLRIPAYAGRSSLAAA